jgi:hypothetical protein
MKTYWTIQTIEKWNKAKQLGYLQGDEEYVDEEFFKPYYYWMMGQMKLRLPNYKGEYPIWLWVKRPDLRQRHMNKGEKGVLIEVDLDENNVLLSDFIIWNAVLNDAFLYVSNEEERLYEEGKSLITIEQSWERIFDFELLKTMTGWTHLDKIQGVTGRIDLKNIRSVREFMSR